MPVYFAQGQKTGTVKIGFSYVPQRRMAQHARQIGEPFVIIRETPGDLATELWFIHRFKHCRVSGREWFRFAPEMLTVEAPTDLPVRTRAAKSVPGSGVIHCEPEDSQMRAAIQLSAERASGICRDERDRLALIEALCDMPPGWAVKFQEAA